MNKNTTAFLSAISSVEGLGPVRIKKLLDVYKEPEMIWQSDPNQFRKFGIPDSVTTKFREATKKIDPQRSLEEIIQKGIRVITIFDAEYPEQLRQMYDPPVVLYYKGQFPKLKRAIGVVGSRKMSSYGKSVTEMLVKGLVESGFVIVSGLARGVDTAAHKTAVENTGQTIAVLGGGLDSIFPSENKQLAEKISLEFGAILSEYPPDYPNLAGNFPLRNRIIAGLSQAVLVTEATVDSGSLITAHLAIEQGKEVFAVPGPITLSTSLGCAQLIKNGAKLVTEIGDILDEFGLPKLERIKIDLQQLNLIEKTVLYVLENESKHVDQIAREGKLGVNQVSATLLKLELMGAVKNLGSGNYARAMY